MGSIDGLAEPHLLFVAPPALSHTRPLLGFAWNLLEQYPELHITLVYPSTFADVLDKEIALRQPPETSLVRIHQRALSVPESTSKLHFVDALEYYRAKLLDYLIELHHSSEGHALRYPHLAIVDLLLSFWPDLIEDAASRIGPDFQRFPSHLFTCTPAAWGVRRGTAPGCARLKMLQATNHQELPQEELIEMAFKTTDGSLVHISSVGDVFDYELQPQMGAVPFDPKMVPHVMHAGWAPHLRRYDATIVATPAELEPGAKEDLQALLGRPVYQIGPQFSEALWHSSPKLSNVVLLNQEDQDTMEFLERSLKRHGKNSVVYVSFGTFYGMSLRPDLIELLLESLLHSGKAFLFAVNKLKPLLSKRILARLEQSELAHITDFSPQHHVLAHPGTGWYLTHAGQSSVAESILFGVPMICWPCMTDQPITALQLSITFQLAFELIQVRTGDSEGRLTTRGVQHMNSTRAVADELQELWKRIQSPEGAEMRARVLDMRDLIRHSWHKGQARDEVKRFRASVSR